MTGTVNMQLLVDPLLIEQVMEPAEQYLDNAIMMGIPIQFHRCWLDQNASTSHITVYLVEFESPNGVASLEVSLVHADNHWVVKEV